MGNMHHVHTIKTYSDNRYCGLVGLPFVCDGVLVDALNVRELPAADGALVRLGAVVHAQMLAQVASRLESAAAIATYEAPVVRVRPYVEQQVVAP